MSWAIRCGRRAKQADGDSSMARLRCREFRLADEPPVQSPSRTSSFRRVHGHLKNAKSVRSNVSTKTERSRYLFPRSQDVSGRKVQAWHAAPCKVVALRRRTPLGTKRVGGTQSHHVQGGVQVTPKPIRTAQRTKPAKRSFAVGQQRCRSTRPPSAHRLQGCCSKSVPVSRPSCSRIRWKAGGSRHGRRCGAERSESQDSRLRASNFLASRHRLWALKNSSKYAPCSPSHFFRAFSEKWKKMPSPLNFRSGNPSRGLPGQGRTLIGRQFCRRVEIARRFQPGESDQCPNLPQLFGQHDLVEESRVAVRRSHYLQPEILAVQCRVRVGEDFPFGLFRSDASLIRRCRRYVASGSPAKLRCR